MGAMPTVHQRTTKRYALVRKDTEEIPMMNATVVSKWNARTVHNAVMTNCAMKTCVKLLVSCIIHAGRMLCVQPRTTNKNAIVNLVSLVIHMWDVI